MPTTINIKGLLVGLLVAIAFSAMIVVSYVVPSWQKKPKPPKPTGQTCERTLDCDDGLVCLNGYCTSVEKPAGFPWLVSGIIAAIVFVILLMISMVAVKNSPESSKRTVARSMLFRLVLVLVGFMAVTVSGYFVYKAKYSKMCPEKPASECPSGSTNICNDGTGFEWHCQSSGDTCGTDAPKCETGIASCNPSTMKWDCPTKVCSKNPPTDFDCPATKDGVDYSPRCDSGTEFDWTCQAGCAASPSSPMSCAPGTHPGCNIESKYAWDCLDDSSNVCGTTIKPPCEGAVCMDTDKGWDWKCPGDFTRDDVIRMHTLSCSDTIINEDTGKPVSICFTDTTHTTPIHPTVGHDCTGEDASQSLGKDLDNVLANPYGNMTSDNKTFQPYDETKRIYYQANPDTPTTCVLSDDLSYKCNNGGLFVQDKKNISKTGKCNCLAPWKGAVCQFSDKTTCGVNGKVDPTGKCSCVSPYVGDKCNATPGSPAFLAVMKDGDCKSVGGFGPFNCPCSFDGNAVYTLSCDGESADGSNKSGHSGGPGMGDGCGHCVEVIATTQTDPNCWTGSNFNGDCSPDKATAIKKAKLMFPWPD